MRPFHKHQGSYSNFCTNPMAARVRYSWYNWYEISRNALTFERNHIPTVVFVHRNCDSCFTQTFHLHYKIYGSPLVVWKHYVQHSYPSMPESQGGLAKLPLELTHEFVMAYTISNNGNDSLSMPKSQLMGIWKQTMRWSKKSLLMISLKHWTENYVCRRIHIRLRMYM